MLAKSQARKSFNLHLARAGRQTPQTASQSVNDSISQGFSLQGSSTLCNCNTLRTSSRFVGHHACARNNA